VTTAISSKLRSLMPNANLLCRWLKLVSYVLRQNQMSSQACAGHFPQLDHQFSTRHSDHCIYYTRLVEPAAFSWCTRISLLCTCYHFESMGWHKPVEPIASLTLRCCCGPVCETDRRTCHMCIAREDCDGNRRSGQRTRAAVCSYGRAAAAACA